MFRKIILLATFFFMICAVCSAETTVQVSDYTVNEFHQAYNQIARKYERNDLIAEEVPSRAINKPGKIYDTYLLTAGRGENRIVVHLVANKAGLISFISFFVWKDKQKIYYNNFAKVLTFTMMAVGLNEEELLEMMNSTPKYNLGGVHWCAKTQRYITLQTTEIKNNAYFIIKSEIKAYVSE